MERVGSKCEHGVYWPVADPINLGCQMCNPDGLLLDGPAPVLPRGTAETPHAVSTNCTGCGNVRTYSSPTCRVCGKLFPEVVYAENTGKKSVGACPACACPVHYETNRKTIWQCAECLKEYRAPKSTDDDGGDDD